MSITIIKNKDKEMAKKTTWIKLPSADVVRQMAKAFSCTETMVYNSLANRTNSCLAQKIRKDAVEVYGGRVETRWIF